MRNLEKVFALKRSVLFANADEYMLTTVADIAAAVEIEPGETFIDEGDWGQDLLMIVAGQVRIHADGVEVTVMKPGDIIGEMALVSSAPHALSASAITHVDLLRIDKLDLDNILLNYPEIAKNMIDILSYQLRERTVELILSRKYHDGIA